jgi:hypothetical protein
MKRRLSERRRVGREKRKKKKEGEARRQGRMGKGVVACEIWEGRASVKRGLRRWWCLIVSALDEIYPMREEFGCFGPWSG